MNKLSEKFVTTGFSLTVLLLCGVGTVSYLSFQQLAAEKRWVIHTHQVIEALHHLRISLSNAENRQKSYILIGKNLYQETYDEERQKVYQEIAKLRKLTSDNPQRQLQLNTLQLLVAQEFALLEQSINLFRQNSLDKTTQVALIEQDIKISAQIQVIDDEEETLLQQRTAATDASFYQIIVFVSLGYALGIFLLIVVYLLLQKQIRINKALSEEAIHLEQQAAKAKLADILEIITDAFVALDRNSCYTYVNQKAGQLLSHRPEELISKNIWQVFPEAVGQDFYHAYCQAVTEQRAIKVEAFYTPWNRWFKNSFYPSSEGMSIFFQDITRPKLAEIALEENERRYRSLVIATSQAVWIADAQGLPKDYSSWIALTGQSDAEIRGGRWLDVIHPEDRRLTELLWNQALETKSLYKIEHRILVTDGSYRFFAARGIPVLNTEGEIQEWVGTHTDITDRKLAEAALQRVNEELEIKVQERTAELQKLNEELKRSNQELEQFAYAASHDLQEPLRAVAGYTQLLGEEYQNILDESAQEYLDYILDGSKRMQQLIQDLLLYSRVGTRGQEFVFVDCNAALAIALNNLHVAIAESKATITHDPLPTLLADKTQITQLFQNLIGNAIKFRQKDVPPQIHIGAARGNRGDEGEFSTSHSAQAQRPTNANSEKLQGGFPSGQTSVTQHLSWLLWVQDNGIGIKSQYLERIFEVFRRLHTRREFPGTGIGLAICKKIVERHGGQIWAESQLGVGTIFYMTLDEK